MSYQCGGLHICSCHQVQYIHKFIFKGHDQITAVMQQDEIKQYLDAKWFGDAEAMYCIFHFHTHKGWSPVERLPIHLLDEQMGVYNPAADSTNGVMYRIAAGDTKMLAFFKLNPMDPNAHNLLYSDIPKNYHWIPGVAG